MAENRIIKSEAVISDNELIASLLSQKNK